MTSHCNVSCETLIAGANRVAGVATASLGVHQWTTTLDLDTHASAAASGSPRALGLVAYGSSSMVALYDPLGMRVLALMNGHTGRVNGVSFLAKPSVIDDTPTFTDETELVSCSSDGFFRVWEFSHRYATDEAGQSLKTLQWQCTAVLGGHKSSATSIASTTMADGTVFIASTSTDGTLRSWFRLNGSNAWVAAAPYQVRGIAVFECVTAAILPGYDVSTATHDSMEGYGVVFATGGVDSRINVFTVAGSPESAKVQHLLTLSGHMDWIRGLSFSRHTALRAHFPASLVLDNLSDQLLLASASQDGKIRLWRITKTTTLSAAASGAAGEDDAEPDVDDDDEAEDDGGETQKIRTRLVDNVANQGGLLGLENPLLAALQRPRKFHVRDISYEVIFDAMLSGHDAWVNSVQWHPPVLVKSGSSMRVWQPPCVVSSSMDKSIIMWQPSGVSTYQSAGAEAASDSLWTGVWEPTLRIGSAGAQVAGLYGALLLLDGSTVLAHAYQGAIHVWACDSLRALPGTSLQVIDAASDFSLSDDASRRLWLARPAALGHFGAVTSVQWGDSGRYLVTTSLDYSTRIWAQSLIKQGSATLARWFEISRPQIHGYEMMTCVLPSLSDVPHRLVSAGDEKVVRIFDAPKLFLRTLQRVSSGALHRSGYAQAGWDPLEVSMDRPEFSYVPELGLTNKPVTTEGAGMPIKDRFQIDGRDADSRAADARAAVLKKATLAAMEEVADAPDTTTDDIVGEMDRKQLNKIKTEAAKHSKADAATLTQALTPAATETSDPSKTLPVSSATAALGVEFVAEDGIPPLEEDLVQNSRWPENNKLFGHANEVICLAANSSGTIIASACKARTAAHACIRLWDAVTGQHLQTLEAHKLTVIQMAFSPSLNSVFSLSEDNLFTQNSTQSRNDATPNSASEFLVSVSKDRSLIVFGICAGTDGSRPKYQLLATIERAHKRIIWSVSWCPIPRTASLLSGSSQDIALFATGARDQTAKLWCLQRKATDSRTFDAPVVADRKDNKDNDEADGLAAGSAVRLGATDAGSTHILALSAVSSVNFESAVTATAFAPVVAYTLRDGRGSMAASCAFGLESGQVHIMSCSGVKEGVSDWNFVLTPIRILPLFSSHANTVRALAWRPLPLGWTAKEGMQLASASDDESVRIHNVCAHY